MRPALNTNANTVVISSLHLEPTTSRQWQGANRCCCARNFDKRAVWQQGGSSHGPVGQHVKVQWSTKFGCSTEQLRAAVTAVGNVAADVARHLSPAPHPDVGRAALRGAFGPNMSEPWAGGPLNDLPSDEIQLDFVAERAIESADMSFMTGFLHSRGCNTW